MWRDVENSNDLKPEELEINVDTVYVRTDFVFIDDGKSNPHWKYREKQFSKAAYDNYLQARELAELLG